MATEVKDRVLSTAQTKTFFEILGDPKKLDAPTMCKLFANNKKTGILFYPSDIIAIGPEQSRFVKPDTVTTCGIYIENKYLLENLGIFGYVNATIDASLNGKIEGAMAKALQEGDITVEQFAEYINRAQFLFGGPLPMIINVSLSQTDLEYLRNCVLTDRSIRDPNTASHIEHAVVDKALEEMQKTNDPSLAYFDSGCGISAYNQYKTICVMKGAIQDNTGESPSGYKIITSNYDEGITKGDMPKIADAVVTTAFSSGVATQDSGTDGKRYNAMFQGDMLADPGSDCGSTDYFETVVRADMLDSYVYRWIMEDGKLKMLTPDNIGSYANKLVKMRSPLHCWQKEPCYCSICYGDRAYRLKTRNQGFFFMTISGSTLNAALKKKHDVSIKLKKISVDLILKHVK